MAADVELTGAVRAALRGAAQPELAGPMQAYMKSATPYLGVRVPVMRAIAIESSMGDSDVFLRKAIGWALRDYARTDPAWVRSFTDTHELSPLSRREALRHLRPAAGR